MELTSGIHCKVSCNGQLRRFKFNGTEFAALHKQVSSILNLDGSKQFVLKYQDEEGDLITVSTDEELISALGYSQDPNLLRLTVVIADKQDGNTKELIIPVSCDFEEGGRGKKWRSERGGRGRCGRGKHGPYDRKERCEERWKNKKSKLEKKKQEIEQKIAMLSKIPESEGNYVFRQRKIEKLNEYLECTNSKLQGNWKIKDAKRELSEEEEKQVYLLRERIYTTKSIINETKFHLGAKKEALKKVLGEPTLDSKAKENLENEISQMKSTIWDLKKQMSQLKNQILSIRNGDSKNNNNNMN